ncbi:MAG TPA: MBL fold metallo-hydrolase [Candidatus Limnocylindrales bacterium]|nr:MBL fold metallo-hydrolase [Candidatus Limnocylindrales bacterium]
MSRRRSFGPDGLWEILPFDAGSFTFPEDEPRAGEEGVVVAHALRASDGSVFLFDTGTAAGDPDLDARYHPVERPLPEALASLGLGLPDVRAATNCHLHADHAGQNHRLTGIPIYVQAAERAAALEPDYTIDAWVNAPGLRYEVIEGDVEVVPGITILATPGHTTGHQSLLVATRRGRVALAGQAIYSRDEWLERPGREGRSSASDQAAYDRSVRRLRGLGPVEVRFAHDRAAWLAPTPKRATQSG